MKCDRCGSEITVPTGSGGTGYATTDKGEKVCYKCCAVEDEQYMKDHGVNTLYLSNGKITNWPGTLQYPANRIHESRHNLGHTRVDVWFYGPDNKIWHGVNIGDNQILRCKRTQRAVFPRY